MFLPLGLACLPVAFRFPRWAFRIYRWALRGYDLALYFFFEFGLVKKNNT